MNYIYIDFEFNRTQEEFVNLVCCSYSINRGIPVSRWLHNSPTEIGILAEELSQYKDTHIFVAYGATAECRSFLSLLLDPHNFQWVDLYLEHMQLIHTCEKYKYGYYYHKTGILKKSVAPKLDPKRNKFRDNTEIGRGYADAVAAYLKIQIDTQHKNEMRDLIIEDRESYTPIQQQYIMKYCESDIKYLPDLHKAITHTLMRELRFSEKTIEHIQTTRGSYSASLAKMEKEGFPVRYDCIVNLRNNIPRAKDSLLEALSEQYPFYTRKKAKAGQLLGEWVETYSMFEKFIIEHESIDEKSYPLSEKTKKFKTDDKTLENYLGIPEIKAYRDTKKLLKQLQWFREPDEPSDDFFRNVGSDKKLRSFLGPLGTKTGRNAPPAKKFLLAMSSWLRCLIQPTGDEAIVGIDYGSQEFIIAAALSKDRKMIEAYESGDPYLYFSKKANAVPEDAIPKLCKSPNIILEKILISQGMDRNFYNEPITNSEILNLAEKFPDEYKIYIQYLEYEKQRNLFKATVLGLQFGLGAANLAIKLTADCGFLVTVARAKELIRMHKSIFCTFWDWLKTVERHYSKNGSYVLKDGFALLSDEKNTLTLKNFPVQGTGAVIMRRAVCLAHQRGIRIIAPLHDAIYAVFNTLTQADHPRILGECMQQAVEDILGKEIVIRQDIDIHDSTHIWIEGKGKKYYNLLSKYLERLETDKDIIDKLNRTVNSIPEECNY